MSEQSNKRIAKNTLFLYIRMAIVMAINLYVTRVVLDVLGVSDYGIYNVVCGFVSMFGFLNTSMANGIQRFYNFELGKNGEDAVVKVYNTALIIQFVLAISIVILTETVGLWYVNTKMVISPDRMLAANWIFQFSVISLIFVIIQIPYSAAILAYEKMDYYAIVSIIDAAMKLAIVFVLPHLSGDSLILYGLMTLFISILNFILYSGYCRKKFKHLRFKKTFDKSQFKSMMSFSGWNLFGSFAYILKGQGVNVLINAFFGTLVNAANGVATQISSAIQTFSANIVLAFKPQLTQSYAKGEYARTELLMNAMSKISFILVCIIAIPVMLDIEFILKIWLGSNIPDHTVVFTRLTIITMMISVLNTPITQVIHATGKMKKYQLVTSCIICSILPISWLFLKLEFPAESVFYIGIVITIINQIICVWVLKTIFDYNIIKYIREVVLFCSLILIAPLLAPNFIVEYFSEGIVRFIMIFIINLILVCASAYILLRKDEKVKISQITKKILNK